MQHSSSPQAEASVTGQQNDSSFIMLTDWHVQAMSERETAVRAAQLSYTDAPIHVEVVQASDLQKAPAPPLGKIPALLMLRSV